MQTTGTAAPAPLDALTAVLPPALRDDHLAPIEECPGFEAAPGFLKSLISGLNLHRVADIGGGANPMLDLDFLNQRNVRYDVLDISQAELDKAAPAYSKIAVDMCAPPEEFRRKVEGGVYDLVFTHTFLEHIEHPEPVHRNIRWMLKPNGLAVHIFPSSANLPLTINRLMPEELTQKIVAFVQPERDLAGKQAKFKAYYKLCGVPSDSIRGAYASFGFRLLRYKAFIGHDYYARFPILRDVEKWLRKPLASLNVPLASVILVIAQPA